MISKLIRRYKQQKREKEVLDAYRILFQLYEQWLASMPEVALVLKNLREEAEGQVPVSNNWPPSGEGPWTIFGLRKKLEDMASAAKVSKEALPTLTYPFKFDQFDVVYHKKSNGLYIILGLPDANRLEHNGAPAYAYRKINFDGVISGPTWHRAQSIMEDGRFMKADHTIKIDHPSIGIYWR